MALFWPGERTIPAIDRDEARFAEASRQMAASGDIVDIRFQDETRYKKPVGIYWLQAASAKLLGEDANNPIWPYRLPSLLGAIAAVLVTFALGESMFGYSAGWLAAGLLATSLLLNVEARLATVDACLLCCSTLLLACLYRLWSNTGTFRHGIGVWVALGCGILLKGPVLPVLAGPMVLTLCLYRRNWRLVRQTRPLPGLFITAGIVLPWLVAIALRSHGGFFHESLGHDFGAKLAEAQESHGGFPGLYLLEFPLAFFPGSVLALAALPAIWRSRCDPDVVFLLAWIVPGWLLFEAVPTKLPHYVLPFYPAIAVLTAKYGPWPKRLWIAGGATVFAYVILFGLIIPRLQSPFIARTLVQHRTAYANDVRQGRVAFTGFHEPSAVLWFGVDTLLTDAQTAAGKLDDGSVALAYVTPDALAEFLKAASDAQKLDEVTGFNLARGRDVTLMVYRRGP